MTFSSRSLLRIVFLTAQLMLGLIHGRAQEPCVTPCEFRFIVYGDSRSGDKIHEDIVSKVVSAQPSFILQTGDLVRSALSKSEWARFDKITETLRQKDIVLYPAVGNHDVFMNKWATESYEARVPPPSRPGSTPLFYAFDRGNIRFISINSLRRKKLKPGTMQHEWLKSELSDARAKGKFVIPYFHIAVFSVGNHGSDKTLQNILHPLFSEYGVRLVFQGHDHNYYRTLRCFTEGSKHTKCQTGVQGGITYIVSGGGGAGLYNNKHKEQAIPGDKFEMANNYIVADVFAREIVMTVYSSVEPLKIPYKKLDRVRCSIDSASPCQVLPID